MLARLKWIAAAICFSLIATSSNAADALKISGDYQYVAGLDRTMLLLQGDVLIRLDADGVTEKERLKLGAKYSHIAERRDYFVALSASPKSVVLLDKKTLKPIREKELSYRNLMDLTLHPKLPLAYVAVEADITAPSFRVVIFDEKSADVHEPRGLFGTWACVHPAGTMLVTGHKDIYERGTTFFINPDWRLHSMPDYGSIDLLITYALDDKGKPSFMDLKSKAGGNGSGLRMSPDGERVTYLSHVGYPQFSANLGGFDPLDLQKSPVTYKTKDRASTHDLAYHRRLPLCASPGNGTAVFFHRETGAVEERLEKSAKYDKVHRVYFAPDGKHLVLDCEKEGVRALRNAELKLSPEEAVLVTKNPDPVIADNTDKVKAATTLAHREIEKKIDPGKVARGKAVDWLKLNNTLGADHKIVADQTAVIDAELAAGRNMQIIFGKDLVKAGTPAYLCIWNGTFFPLSLSKEQAAAFDFPKNNVVKISGNKSGWRLTESQAQLHDLKFANVDAVDGTRNLTGSVKYKRLDTEPGYYALSIQYIVNDRCVTSYHQLGENLPKSEGEIEFSFTPILADKNTHKGPLPVFVELVTFATAERRDEPAIASNTIARIVTVKGK